MKEIKVPDELYQRIEKLSKRMNKTIPATILFLVGLYENVIEDSYILDVEYKDGRKRKFLLHDLGGD